MTAVMYLDSPTALNNQHLVEDILYSSVEVLFGVRISNLPKSLFDSAYIAITDRFIGITIQDLQNAFRYAEIEKKAYVSLSRDEVIQPIKDYWFKKSQVDGVIVSITQMEQKEKDEIEKYREFKEQSKQKYLQSLKESRLLLNEYECASIAKNFAECLHMDKKKELTKQAQREHKALIFQEKENVYSVIPSMVQIYSRLFIEEMLNRGQKFIEI